MSTIEKWERKAERRKRMVGRCRETRGRLALQAPLEARDIIPKVGDNCAVQLLRKCWHCWGHWKKRFKQTVAWGGLLLWKFIPGPDSHNAASGSWPLDHICCVHVMILLRSGSSSLTLGPGKYQSLVGINHPAMVRIDTTECSRFLSSANFFLCGFIDSVGSHRYRRNFGVAHQ